MAVGKSLRIRREGPVVARRVTDDSRGRLPRCNRVVNNAVVRWSRRLSGALVHLLNFSRKLGEPQPFTNEMQLLSDLMFRKGIREQTTGTGHRFADRVPSAPRPHWNGREKV